MGYSVSSWRRIDAIFLSTLTVAFISWFVVINVSTVFGRGLGSADDGYFAFISKYVALGKGYGVPVSSTEFIPFSQDVGLGPAFILVGAAATWLFGAHDWLLGLLTLLTFCLQVGVAGILLGKKFGACESLATGLIALLSIALLSAPGAWFFGSFLGEAPAFGWLLLGAVLLVWESTIAVVAAGLCFALAALTKQIALFSSAGMIFGWLVVELQSRHFRTLARRFVLMLFSCAMPLAVWEAFRLIAVGPLEYYSIWEATAWRAMPESDDLPQRVREFLATFQRVYGPPLVVLAFALASLITATFTPKREELVRFIVPLWCGVISYFAYIILLAPLWSRYFWIGVAVGCVAIAAPLLVVRPVVRTSVIAAALGGCIALPLFEPAIGLQRWASNSDLLEERQAVLKTVSEHPLPVAGQTWASFFDILYLKNDLGEWVQERDLERLRGRDFLAIVNSAFTAKEGVHGKFYRSVSGSCFRSMEGQQYSVFLCGDGFWSSYGKD